MVNANANTQINMPCPTPHPKTITRLFSKARSLLHPSVQLLAIPSISSPENLLLYYLPSLFSLSPKTITPRRTPKYMPTSAKPPPNITTIGTVSSPNSPPPSSPLSIMQVAAECKDHMAAEIDTTGDALSFLMWELSQPQHATPKSSSR
ncbi:hypothetical protein EYZ11_008112 [Aspergillus tanneri]|uniref:Uncharacterized protein n=1 Tax=Aspergillus tanneri TaxID=1220188 RepID=A0A4S3JBL8_9EURO|nr:hypothetical protein EYZ11_008112 [Aspergillus tanneri]